MIYDLSVATRGDVPEILALQSENQIFKGGALSVEFPAAWFETTVQEMPIIIARRRGQLVGYLVSSAPERTKDYALGQAKFTAYPAKAGAYNSGPLCVEASERGQGLAEMLFELQGSLLRGREGVGFIRRDNAASRAAHAKYGFSEVAKFTYHTIEYLVVARTT